MRLEGRGLWGLVAACLLYGGLLSSLHPQAQSDDEIPNNELRLFDTERGFRLNATHKVMPEFPAEALKDGAQGVVVLSLYHDADGYAAYIKVLESPHPAISEAAIRAVQQWRWRVFVSGNVARPVKGKLTFYFVMEDGAGRVEDPRIIIEEEMNRRARRLPPSW